MALCCIQKPCIFNGPGLYHGSLEDLVLYTEAESPSSSSSSSSSPQVEKNCVALATSILQLIGPYNYIVCAKCGSKNKGGSQCSTCGKKLKVRVDLCRC
jgi:hypothetical protein